MYTYSKLSREYEFSHTIWRKSEAHIDVVTLHLFLPPFRYEYEIFRIHIE